MKKFLCIALSLISLNAMAQGKVLRGILDRFDDPERGKVVFIEKGHRAIGISGGYRSFTAGGDASSDGYYILSMLNIGNGSLRMWNVTPSFSYFIADDLSLGVRLNYKGYNLDTNIKLDLRDLIDTSFIDDQETQQEVDNILNLKISGRHMIQNSWGTALALRKYLSFFGSQTFAVFGEARLYGSYALVKSCPIDSEGQYNYFKQRTSHVWSTGLKFGVGVCMRLRDNSAITVGIPIAGINYSNTRQLQERKNGSTNTARMSQFSVSRELDLLSIQIGYTRYIKARKKK